MGGHRGDERGARIFCMGQRLASRQKNSIKFWLGFKVEASHNNPHWDWEIDVKQITLRGCS